METDDNLVARSLPVDGALVSDILLRLRRDAGAPMVRWTLGENGAVEVDVNFTSDGPRFTTSGRLWDRTGLALLNITFALAVSAPDTAQLSLELPDDCPPWWQARREQLDALAHAALDELSEELLWHAARAGVAAGS
jgi:hypothetical protein